MALRAPTCRALLAEQRTRRGGWSHTAHQRRGAGSGGSPASLSPPAGGGGEQSVCTQGTQHKQTNKQTNNYSKLHQSTLVYVLACIHTSKYYKYVPAKYCCVCALTTNKHLFLHIFCTNQLPTCAHSVYRHRHTSTHSRVHTCTHSRRCLPSMQSCFPSCHALEQLGNPLFRKTS